MSIVSKIYAREILDSRGNPAVEVDVTLDDGTMGRASVPSGASTGAHEVVELRDGDKQRYNGLGVRTALRKIACEIAPHIMGMDPQNQSEIDSILSSLDGTPNLSRLGGNAILGISMAVAHAESSRVGVPLYRQLSNGLSTVLPVPMFNILNGGRHAKNSTDVQEFMVVPAGFETLSQAVQAGVEIYHVLKYLLDKNGLGTNIGDEGGFAPSVNTNREGLDLLLQAIETAGYLPGEQCFIAMDIAATELLTEDGKYSLTRESEILTAHELISLYTEWTDAYPIISIEDGMGEDDWEGWSELTRQLGNRVQLVGDDLFATNPTRIRTGIKKNACTAALIKMNQIGTITKTLEAIRTTKDAGWATVVSHRSGETEDTTIADLAVGTSVGQIKAGAPCRGERTAKYNRLLRIEEGLGNNAEYAGLSVYNSILNYQPTESLTDKT
ncbi:MAG: phosphopyruvate hydratase [SAR202 cluster bacterium]|jgi:enolase|nr:phosphopyruvate hydratase [SAR202 cluster bacterium]